MSRLKVGKRTGLKRFDIEDVRGWKPCYAPEKHLVKGKRYNAVGILRREDIGHADRLWVVLRTDLCSERVMRLFAVWSARQVPQTDPRCVACLEVAERYANGQATEDERSAAWSAAESAAWSAAESARSAAWSAAWSAAESAESAAAESAESAARSAWSAAESAESAAAESAESAESAAESAESAQREKLIEMLLIEGKERLAKRNAK